MNRSPHLTLGKLIGAGLLALVVGYLWACVEARRSPLTLLSLFGSKEPEAPAPAPAARKEPARPEPAPARKEPAKPEPVAPKPPEPVAPPPAPKVYSAVEMNSLFGALDDYLRRGRFFEAHERVKNTSKLMIPADQAPRFGEYELRIRAYNDLIQETTKGVTIDMPKMTRILIKNAGKLIVKVLSEDGTSVYYETLTGIRSKIARDQAEKIEPLDPIYANAEVTLELKAQCKYKGLLVEGEPGKPLAYKDMPGRKVTGLQFFDLADFCARNGANDKLLPLFDEALRRDPDLLTTVHEAKAERLVNVLLYFLSINSTADATKTYDMLRERYKTTRAYREHVESDADVRTALAGTARRPAPDPIARADSKPPPAPPKPDAPPAPRPPEPVKPAPEPARPPEPGGEPPAARPANPTAVSLPEGLPPKAGDLIARGDRYFDEAMRHLQNSDPTINPEGWADENKKALEFFTKANQECYYPAQELFPGGSVPQPLLDRVRETTLRSSLCRKRSVSSRK
jgi:outer membrane biosynthesis protein TonB